jgi:hypothetical protein
MWKLYDLDKEAGWGLNVDNLQVWGVTNRQ